MKLIVDKGPFDLSLQKWSIIIAIWYLVITPLTSVFIPFYYAEFASMISFIITIIGNVCLLIGALKLKRVLVLVWLIQAGIIIILWVIGFFGIIFSFGSYRYYSMFHSVIWVISEWILLLVILLFAIWLVYSFYLQLKKAEAEAQANPQVAVVV